MSKHKMIAACPFADSDDGMEVEIAFNYTRGAPATGPSYASGGDPGYPAEVYLDAIKPADPAVVLTQPLLNALVVWANNWLADGPGYRAALDVVDDDDEAAREYAAELRRDI